MAVVVEHGRCYSSRFPLRHPCVCTVTPSSFSTAFFMALLFVIFNAVLFSTQRISYMYTIHFDLTHCFPPLQIFRPPCHPPRFIFHCLPLFFWVQGHPRSIGSLPDTTSLKENGCPSPSCQQLPMFLVPDSTSGAPLPSMQKC